MRIAASLIQVPHSVEERLHVDRRTCCSRRCASVLPISGTFFFHLSTGTAPFFSPTPFSPTYFCVSFSLRPFSLPLSFSHPLSRADSTLTYHISTFICTRFAYIVIAPYTHVQEAIHGTHRERLNTDDRIPECGISRYVHRRFPQVLRTFLILLCTADGNGMRTLMRRSLR